MKIFLLIIMLSSGQTTKIDYASYDSCVSTKTQLKEDLPKNNFYVTCQLDTGRN